MGGGSRQYASICNPEDIDKPGAHYIKRFCDLFDPHDHNSFNPFMTISAKVVTGSVTFNKNGVLYIKFCQIIVKMITTKNHSEQLFS